MISRIVAASLVAGTLVVAPAAAAPPQSGFVGEVVDASVVGPAFAVTADVGGDAKPELVVSSFGRIVTGQPMPSGTVGVYALSRDRRWQRTEVVSQAAGIPFPGEPTVADLDADGDMDMVVPGGFFICPISGSSCGSLTWWEQDAGSWHRHDLVAVGDPRFYHRAVIVDYDGDGRLDLVTVAETAASAQVEVYRGVATPDRFDRTPVVLGVFGGSLPVVEDVDGDGDLDVASAQYFLRGASFAWLERVAGALDPHVAHTMSATEGGAIELANVPGIGWVGSNHTNTTSGPPGTPESGIYLLTPQGDPRLPWQSRRISEGIVSRADSGAGQQQGAPGVFGYGDVDRDGDTDLAVSGDGDRRLFLIEQTAPGAFATRVIAEDMGQAGGGDIVDVDGDRRPEVLFTSYDRNLVTLWRPR